MEFSRALTVKTLPQKTEIPLKATEEECGAIAQRLGLVRLDSFVSVVKVIPLSLKKTQLDIQLNATLIQSCVASLKDVEESISEAFSLYVVEGPEPDSSQETLEDLAAEEIETLYAEEHLNLGEVLVQYLSLFLNPYPRHPEGAFKMPDEAGGSHPLSALNSLKKR